ncbi:MAG: hypothetical protein K2X87_13020 [Gemmataceae bacterium]|nr:hypothetical protein [Gemmataceae bacterium]
MASDDEPDDGDDLDPVGPARPLLVAAARLADRIAGVGGDPDGAADVLACAARLTRKVRGLGEVADFRLDRALDEAENETAPKDRLAALRDGIDSLLGEVEEGEELPAEPLPQAQTLIGMAIGIGAPAYNTGDKQGCYEVYAATAGMVLGIPELPEEAAAKLRDGLEKSDALDDPEAQAWAMRHAFDAVGEMGPGGAGLAPREVKAYLAMAVGVGAPAFNLGDHRGCYEVYAAAARLLVNSQAVPDAVKDPLRAALEKASTIPGVTRQVLVLREAFDALLTDSVEPDKDEDGKGDPDAKDDGGGT